MFIGKSTFGFLYPRGSNIKTIKAIDPDTVRLARSMRGGSWRTFWKICLPNALPNVFAGLKMAITFSVIGAVVGEFVAGTQGLGYLIQSATGSMQTTTAFASIVLLSAMGIILFVVIETIERLIIIYPSSSNGH